MKIAAASASVAEIVRAILLPKGSQGEPNEPAEPNRRAEAQTDIAARTILRSVWLHYHLHAAILFVAERPVHLGRVVERHAMRHDKRRIDLARFDVAQQTRQV